MIRHKKQSAKIIPKNHLDKPPSRPSDEAAPDSMRRDSNLAWARQAEDFADKSLEPEYPGLMVVALGLYPRVFWAVIRTLTGLSPTDPSSRDFGVTSTGAVTSLKNPRTDHERWSISLSSPWA
jgi:hypothetical protein